MGYFGITAIRDPRPRQTHVRQRKEAYKANAKGWMSLGVRTRPTIPKDKKPRQANIHVVPKLFTITIPMCANAAASKKDGIKKAATADAATLG
jgi:hypothetical protein